MAIVRVEKSPAPSLTIGPEVYAARREAFVKQMGTSGRGYFSGCPVFDSVP